MRKISDVLRRPGRDIDIPSGAIHYGFAVSGAGSSGKRHTHPVHLQSGKSIDAVLNGPLVTPAHQPESVLKSSRRFFRRISIGRTNLAQHRNFLDTCDKKDWLNVFADKQSDAQRWMGILEEYLDSPTGDHEYYQWMKQFVSIYQISRWLTEYTEGFLNINRIKQSFALDQIIALRTSAMFSGGGLDAPALNRALGMGDTLCDPGIDSSCRLAPRPCSAPLLRPRRAGVFTPQITRMR